MNGCWEGMGLEADGWTHILAGPPKKKTLVGGGQSRARIIEEENVCQLAF